GVGHPGEHLLGGGVEHIEAKPAGGGAPSAVDVQVGGDRAGEGDLVCGGNGHRVSSSVGVRRIGAPTKSSYRRKGAISPARSPNMALARRYCCSTRAGSSYGTPTERARSTERPRSLQASMSAKPSS